MIKTQTIEYKDGNTTLLGFLAYDDKGPAKKPGVLVAHDWSGIGEFACKKAENLAELGFVGFALDMFGNGMRGNTKEEKSALIRPFIQDRMLLQKRMLAAIDALKKIEQVKTSQMGAIGFCFGGLCVLDLARSGADVQGVVSFHGLLNAPENMTKRKIKSKVLALHGYDDPMVTPDAVMKFSDEMTEAKVDWQLNMYGNAMHAFTNPEAHDKSFGTVYNKEADARSWIAMKDFFREVFAAND
jgi:dienelactone hydrolase